MSMLRVVVCFALAASQRTAAEPLHPLVFVGGAGASLMKADLNKTSAPHWYCSTQYKDYDLWLYYRTLTPFWAPCWLDNMRLRWRDGKMQDAGIEVRLVGDELGEQEDINKGFAKDLWSDLLLNISSLGYSGTSPHVGALHYDWRMSVDQLMVDGTFANMQKQIETRVAAADGKRAVLTTLSFGSPLMHKFLTQFVDSAWKQKFVERWISLSGVFGGVVELTRMALYPEPMDFFDIPKMLPYISLEALRDMSNTFPSSFAARPTYMRDDETLVSANVAGQLRNYTKHDMAMALEDSGLSAARQVYKSSEHAYSFDDLDGPGVTVDCIYGTGDETVDAIHFDLGFNKHATHYGYEDGDGVAPTRSLSMCAKWSSPNESDPKVSVHPIPHIGHGGPLHNNVALQIFSQIIHSLYPPASNTRSSRSPVFV